MFGLKPENKILPNVNTSGKFIKNTILFYKPNLDSHTRISRTFIMVNKNLLLRSLGKVCKLAYSLILHIAAC